MKIATVLALAALLISAPAVAEQFLNQTQPTGRRSGDAPDVKEIPITGNAKEIPITGNAKEITITGNAKEIPIPTAPTEIPLK